MEYKWVVLSNTTVGTLLAFMNNTIVIISLPAIFNGIKINPLSPNAFQYLLWVLMGYSLVTASLLVTLGRLSDMYGRVKLYNMGFLVFTIGSILLYLTPNTGVLGALEIIIFRLVQAVGGALLMVNSAALLTDAFPINERGFALGLNQVVGLAGGLVGLILGGVLAIYDWRYVFLVSVPFGIFGTIWSYLRLREVRRPVKEEVDWAGNAVFVLGLTFILLALTYGIAPYGKSLLGWDSPLVIGSFIAGLVLLGLFPIIESRVKAPMFRLELFRIRMFTAATLATTLRFLAYGSLMIMLTLWLQAIWLPLHGIPYEETPLWAGIYMIPLMLGFLMTGPVSGWLSDRYGPRLLATLGMMIMGIGFLALATLPYNFQYPIFALITFMLGIGNGLFSSPNTASIMNSVPPQHRGAANGMRTTLQNTAQAVSFALAFTIVIIAFAGYLPQALATALSNAGASALVPYITRIPPTVALFAAFLGYDPVRTMLSMIPQGILSNVPQGAISSITRLTWFPNAIAPAFMDSLHTLFYVSSALAFVAAIASALRGQVQVYEEAKQGVV
ncbi:MAG: MFS transporter [Vulcanisaeta sp. AZ3]|jgi:MFS family permease